jgi:hypothetical protein
MEQHEVIKSILAAKNYTNIFPDLKNWSGLYKTYAKQIHPDVCKLPNGSDALAKLNRFKDEINNGIKHKDDAGDIICKPYSITITGTPKLLKKSLDNWKILMSYTDDGAKHFQKYLPETGQILSDGKLEFTFYDRAVPLATLGVLPHEHVNWITNRMLEIAAWISEKGFVHCGINPDSVFIMPENHGAILTSFYHMTKIDDKVTTVSGRYKNFYPLYLFTNKKAAPSIDNELIKRTATYVLGDRSGSGTKLRKTHNIEILDFLKKTDHNALASMELHKKVVKKNFETKYHILNA